MAADLPAGFAVRKIDLRNADDADLARYHAFHSVLQEEFRPGEPFEPLDVTASELRATPSFTEDWNWFVTPDGSDEVVAIARCTVDRIGANEHVLWTRIEILAPWRRRGIGTHLLSLAVDTAKAARCTMLMGGTSDFIPSGEAFARKVAADPGIVERESELVLAEVDWSMVDRWVEQGPDRAPGYELVLVEGAYPEEDYEQIAKVNEVMNGAPRDTLQIEDEHYTAEQMVEWERQFAAIPTERWSIFAKHVESDTLVGLTDVYWNPWTPTVVYQGNTGVDPAHRGHALGKWLKAAMLQKIRAERPQAERVRTWNAYSNDPMLGINNTLGFAVTRSNIEWQIEADKVAANLGIA